MESLRFLNDLAFLTKHPFFGNQASFKQIASKRQIEHLYVTLMMHCRDQDPHLTEDAGIVFAKLYKNYPFLLHSDNLVPGVSYIESGMMFSEKRALLRLKESIWLH